MIVELRTYTFHPGGVADFLNHYGTGPADLQARILGNRIGYFVTETGTLNQIVHLWGYASYEDRLERRARLLAEPEWKTFLMQILPLLQEQESKILAPTQFSPIA